MPLSKHQLILGIDIGSVSVALVAVDLQKKIVHSAYECHHGKPERTLREILAQVNLKSVAGVAATAGTPPILKAARYYDSRVAVLRAAKRHHGNFGSILVVGGEKFGLIRLDERGNYLGYKSNTGCAAGTGSFLDQQALRLNLSGAAELSRIAYSNTGFVPNIASRCAVFAKTDLAHAQQEGRTIAEICDGLCLGLARSIIDTLFTADAGRGPIVLTGGVSLNRAVVRHLRRLLGLDIICDGTLLLEAVGAALSLVDECRAWPASALQSAEDVLAVRSASQKYSHAPLELMLSDYPDFSSFQSYRYDARSPHTGLAVEVDVYRDMGGLRHLAAYLGIDIGSTSTKAILIDTDKTVLAGFYTRTAGNPVVAVQALQAAILDLMDRNQIDLAIKAAGTTGAGRKFIGNIIGADIAVDEISTHARAAVEIDPRVDTIIEIGGQDSKFVTLRNGHVTSAVMNNVCAAGTGSFIEEQARRLGCPLSSYARRAAGRQSPMASDRCTVFMERDLNHYLNTGYAVEELLAAVLHSVRENYLTKVADESSIGDVISFQGATAKNKALVAAFESRLGKPIKVSPFCHLTGALGTALMLIDRNVRTTRFRGLDLHRRHIPLSNETCQLCRNHCNLTLADLGDTREAYGFMCGRDYDTRHYVNNNRAGFDLLSERSRIFASKKRDRPREKFTIGIPAALHLLEDLPFWRFFFDRLGIKTVSSQGFQVDINDGKRLAAAEFCAPITALHAHVLDLLRQSDYIFLPFYLDKKGRDRGPRRQYCYYTQFAPGLTKIAAGQQNPDQFLMPVAHYLYSDFHTKAQLYRILKARCQNRLRYFDVSAAFDSALAFKKSCQLRWRAVYRRHTGSNTDLHAVLLGRPYHILSPAMHKGIPNILAAMGIKAFFQDMLSYSREQVKSIEPLLQELHWHFAAKILEAAEVVAKTPGAYPVLMTAFKCSPDSFVIDYFKKIMESHDKPYLVLQLDDHASTGGYETRIEAAVRAFRNHHALADERPAATALPPLVASKAKTLLNRTLIIPNWDPITCKLLVANLKRMGIDARCLEETPSAIRKSMRYNSGQCIPLNIIAQEFMDYIHKHRLDPAHTALWVTVGEIACNIKLYPHYIKRILNEYGNGMQQAEVYVGELSMIDISVALPINIYFAYMVGGMIRKIGCKIRPYECYKGDTDRTITDAVDILHDAILLNRPLADALEDVVSKFASIPRGNPKRMPPRPKVALFGDLYTRDNNVINQNLIHFIEENGGEVITTPYSEYLKMVSRPYLRKWLIEGRYLSAISSKALMASLRKKEKYYYALFERILGEPEPEYTDSPKDILARYNVRLENTGESMDNILKIHYIKKHHPDVALFVQASPAFCCPALVTEAMANEIERQMGTPVVSITYDGAGGNPNDAIIPYLKFPRETGRQQQYSGFSPAAGQTNGRSNRRRN